MLSAWHVSWNCSQRQRLNDSVTGWVAWLARNGYLRLLRTKSKTRRLRSSAQREVKNLATGIERTGHRAQATRARARADGGKRSNWPTRPTDFTTVQYFIKLPLSCMVFLSQQTLVYHISEKIMETFSGRLWEIPGSGNVWKLYYTKISLITKTPWFSSKQSLECLPRVFITDKPTTSEKKQLLSICSPRF